MQRSRLLVSTINRLIPNKYMTDDNKSKRGFAGMDPDRQRDIASAGGRAAHEKGTAHEFDSEEARKAGQKGGQSRGKDQGGPQNTNTGGNM